MIPDEKERLLLFFGEPGSWCQDAEARDNGGSPVRYDDAQAVAWDITGGLCRLFGWRRACALFRQIHRHIMGQSQAVASDRSPELAAMAALQDYNDEQGTTYERVMEQLRSMPVWRGAGDGAARQ